MFSSSAAAAAQGTGEAPGAIRNLQQYFQQYLQPKRGQPIMALDSELREINLDDAFNARRDRVLTQQRKEGPDPAKELLRFIGQFEKRSALITVRVDVYARVRVCRP